MGRKKIELKKIECLKERSSKYSKRKKGILKKADEISLLCDVDIVMVLISPTDKPTLFHTRSRSLNQILNEFCKTSLAEREERRDYTIKTLKNLVFKNNKDIPIEIDHHSPQKDDEVILQDDRKAIELREVKELLEEKNLILEDWENPFKVNDLDQLNIMEAYLQSSLGHIRKILKV